MMTSGYSMFNHIQSLVIHKFYSYIKKYRHFSLYFIRVNVISVIILHFKI